MCGYEITLPGSNVKVQVKCPLHPDGGDLHRQQGPPGGDFYYQEYGYPSAGRGYYPTRGRKGRGKGKSYANKPEYPSYPPTGDFSSGWEDDGWSGGKSQGRGKGGAYNYPHGASYGSATGKRVRDSPEQAGPPRPGPPYGGVGPGAPFVEVPSAADLMEADEAGNVPQTQQGPQETTQLAQRQPAAHQKVLQQQVCGDLPGKPAAGTKGTS